MRRFNILSSTTNTRDRVSFWSVASRGTLRIAARVGTTLVDARGDSVPGSNGAGGDGELLLRGECSMLDRISRARGDGYMRGDNDALDDGELAATPPDDVADSCNGSGRRNVPNAVVGPLAADVDVITGDGTGDVDAELVVDDVVASSGSETVPAVGSENERSDDDDDDDDDDVGLGVATDDGDARADSANGGSGVIGNIDIDA
jgi:hypothetical protein